MKNFLPLLLFLLCSCIIEGYAQRTIGTTRNSENNLAGVRAPNGRNDESRNGENSPPSPPIVINPLPIRPHPTPTTTRPTCIDSPPPASDVIVYQVKVEEKPKVLQAALQDCGFFPDRSGFDFSAEEVVDCTSREADIYLEARNEGYEIIVGADADIQIHNYSGWFELETVPSSNWTNSHRAYVEPENVYVVWTWDNQFYKFRIVSRSDRKVLLEFGKMEGGSRVASNVQFRNGVSRRNNLHTKFGQ